MGARLDSIQINFWGLSATANGTLGICALVLIVLVLLAANVGLRLDRRRGPRSTLPKTKAAWRGGFER
jgi:hypothetical protein